MLGWVAAVSATESPSQLSPALIQRTWTTVSSGGASVVVTTRPPAGRARVHAARLCLSASGAHVNECVSTPLSRSGRRAVRMCVSCAVRRRRPDERAGSGVPAGLVTSAARRPSASSPSPATRRRGAGSAALAVYYFPGCGRLGRSIVGAVGRRQLRPRMREVRDRSTCAARRRPSAAALARRVPAMGAADRRLRRRCGVEADIDAPVLADPAIGRPPDGRAVRYERPVRAARRDRRRAPRSLEHRRRDRRTDRRPLRSTTAPASPRGRGSRSTLDHDDAGRHRWTTSSRSRASRDRAGLCSACRRIARVTGVDDGGAACCTTRCASTRRAFRRRRGAHSPVEHGAAARRSASGSAVHGDASTRRASAMAADAGAAARLRRGTPRAPCIAR